MYRARPTDRLGSSLPRVSALTHEYAPVVFPAVITANIATLNRQIDPTTIQSQGTWTPLTIAMMNDPTSPYWAQPADSNGRLQTSNVRRVLPYFVGSNGSALTGVTGLSTADIPYFWADPNGTNG